MSNLKMPSGDVTLMFTDIEGSTKKWDQYQESFRSALGIHNRLVRQAIALHEGYEVKTIGDSFMVAFATPISAALCALEIQRLLEGTEFEEVEGLRVRIGLHTSDLTPTANDYFGPPVNHAARIEAAGHGGQIVLSEQTYERIYEDLPEGASLVDRGLHGLKDLSEPIRLFTLYHLDLPERKYPALRTMETLPHNFPNQVTSFVGREREIAELHRLITLKKTRLVTLTGPGGTGKTRLATRVGAECIDAFPDGVWMIDLVNVASAREVPTAVSLALDMKLTNDADVRGQIVAHLREKKALLLFDNFEHVIEASRFLTGLIKDCRDICCLVTSQHLLSISGEHEFPLSPLELPPDDVSLEDCMKYAGVRLFVERATAARPNFNLDENSLPAIVEICKRLEGLPLSVELTAALCRGLTPQQILPRLKDRFKLLASSRRDLDDRQRSLRGALDWSYDLLSDSEKSLYSDLSVFVGGFSVEAVEAVCPAPDTLDSVFSLRDKSLVRATELDDEIRYSMLESIREYAREKRTEFAEDETHSGDFSEEIENRHAAFYLHLAQLHSPKLLNAGPEVEQARKILELELANMRAGMHQYVEQNQKESIIGYGKELSRFLQIRGLYSECEEILNLAENIAREVGDKKSLAMLLNRHGLMAWQRSDYHQAIPLFEESYLLGKELGDKNRMIMTSINLGNIAWGQSRFNDAERIWTEALDLSVESGQLANQSMLLGSLGIIATRRGDFESAANYYDKSCLLSHEAGFTEGLADTLLNYSELLNRMQRFPEALVKLGEARNLYRSLGKEYGLLHVDIMESMVFLEQDKISEAEKQLEKALTQSRKFGMLRTEMYAALGLARVKVKRGEIDAAKEFFRLSFHLAEKVGDRRHMADVITYAGQMHKLQGNLDSANSMQLFADSEYRAMGLKNDLFTQETQKNLSEMIESARNFTPAKRAEAFDLI